MFKKSFFVFLIFSFSLIVQVRGDNFPSNWHSEESVTYDLKKVSHPFFGFGTQLWAYGDNPKNPHHRESRFKALQEMQIKFIRIENYCDHASWDELRQLREDTDSLGIKWVYVIWRTKDQKIGKMLDSEEKVAYFAKEWGKIVSELYDHHIPIEYIELVNEPDSKGSWSTGIAPFWYNQALTAVRKELDKRGLSAVKIIGPGLSNMSRSDQAAYIENISHHNAKKLAAWSVHPWADEDCQFYPDGALSLEYWWEKIFGPAIRMKNPKIPVFVTEFSSTKCHFHGIEYPHGDHYGGWNEEKYIPNYSVANSMPFAARTYENALAFLNKGANSAFFWQINDEWPESIDKEKSWGFIDLWGNPKPVYEAMHSLASRLPVGAKVLAAPDQKGNNLYTGAFVHQNRVIIGMANSKPYEQNIKVTLKNLDGKIKSVESMAYETAEQGNPITGIPDRGAFSHKDLKGIKYGQGHCSFKVSLPANSVLTIVLEH